MSRVKARSVHDELSELHTEVMSLRVELSTMKRQLENATKQFSNMTSPIGSTLRCFPIRTPAKFTSMAWIPFDGHASTHWWYASDDVPPHVRFLVIDPEHNVVKDSAGKIFVRFTSEDNPDRTPTDAPTTLLAFLGYAVPRAYTKDTTTASSGIRFIQVPI
jgi:hypothetical protein